MLLLLDSRTPPIEEQAARRINRFQTLAKFVWFTDSPATYAW